MDTTDFRICLGNNLKRLRKQHGLTQSSLAEVFGMETHNLNRIENGKSFPKPETLTKITNHFKISPYELFLDENDKISLIIHTLQRHPERIDDIFNILQALTENASTAPATSTDRPHCPMNKQGNHTTE